jgi:hypothetical protein
MYHATIPPIVPMVKKEGPAGCETFPAPNTA